MPFSSNSIEQRVAKSKLSTCPIERLSVFRQYIERKPVTGNRFFHFGKLVAGNSTMQRVPSSYRARATSSGGAPVVHTMSAAR
jgi:hypothetical protein